MKSRDYMNNLREMTAEELQDKRLKLEDEIFRLRYQAITEQTGHNTQVQDKRKDLARLLTILNGRQQGNEKQRGA